MGDVGVSVEINQSPYPGACALCKKPFQNQMEITPSRLADKVLVAFRVRYARKVRLLNIRQESQESRPRLFFKRPIYRRREPAKELLDEPAFDWRYVGKGSLIIRYF